MHCLAINGLMQKNNSKLSHSPNSVETLEGLVEAVLCFQSFYKTFLKTQSTQTAALVTRFQVEVSFQELHMLPQTHRGELDSGVRFKLRRFWLCEGC